MGTTSNNSWPYPESSDYVADGATAIENLADAIDADFDTAVLKVDSANSRVGINISSPSSPLHIKADSFDMLSLDRTDNAGVDQQVILTPTFSGSGNTAFAIKIGTEIMRVTEQGRVGINDTTPSYELDVDGDINATGDVKVDGVSLSRDILGSSQSGADTTVTTSDTDVASVTFTLAETRTVGVLVGVGLADAKGGSASYIYHEVQNTNAAGSPSSYYCAFYNELPAITGQSFSNIAYIGLGAGTYTFYWVAKTDTGTIRLNGQASTNMRNRLVVWDAGS